MVRLQMSFSLLFAKSVYSPLTLSLSKFSWWFYINNIFYQSFFGAGACPNGIQFLSAYSHKRDYFEHGKKLAVNY